MIDFPFSLMLLMHFQRNLRARQSIPAVGSSSRSTLGLEFQPLKINKITKIIYTYSYFRYLPINAIATESFLLFPPDNVCTFIDKIFHYIL